MFCTCPPHFPSSTMLRSDSIFTAAEMDRSYRHAEIIFLRRHKTITTQFIAHLSIKVLPFYEL